MPLLPVSLDDKYDLGKSRVFVSGFQALVRLCLMQKERDRRAGLNTAGYVTGYRGSPLGTLDQQFMRAGARLKANDILLMPRDDGGTPEKAAAAAAKAINDGAENFPDRFVANPTWGATDGAAWLKLSASEDGSFTVTNGRTGWTKSYDVPRVP